MIKYLWLCFATSFSFQTLAQGAVAVTVQQAKSLAFYPVKSAPAKVINLNHAKIPARISSVIEQLNYRVGDAIKRSDVIAQLDCQDIKLVLIQLEADEEQSQINLAFNRREFTRITKLSTSNVISEAKLDQANTNVKSAKARFKAINASLQQQQLKKQRCNIIAPFDGIITQRFTNVGEQINQGQSVVELLQTGQLEVSAQVALTDQNAFSNAGDYWLEVDTNKYPLTLRQTIPQVANNSRSLENRLDFTSHATYSGVTGRVKWHTPSLYLPAYLLQQRNKQLGFFVLQAAQAIFIPVANAQEGRPIKLDAPIHSLVIIDGRFGLQHQQSVRIKSAATVTTKGS